MQENESNYSNCTKNIMFNNENKNKLCLNLKLLKLKVIHSFEQIESDLEYKWNIKKNTISVITNKNHKKYRISKDKTQLQINHIENSVFEQILMENSMEITLDYIIFIRELITKSIMEDLNIF